MAAKLRTLPLEDEAAFFADMRNEGAAESYLRRALEALLDLGRHILAKGFGEGVSEYKEIARRLGNCRVLTDREASLLEEMAGYRNRMVHFYHEISSRELYEICATRLGDIDSVLEGFKRWLREHPERLDDRL
jgi:uncharacterized protein YutE (UPF0331/DUF86 family)